MRLLDTPAMPGDETFIETDDDVRWVSGFTSRWEARDPDLSKIHDVGTNRELARAAVAVNAFVLSHEPDNGMVAALMEAVRETHLAIITTVGLHAWQAGYVAGVAASKEEPPVEGKGGEAA